MTLVTNYYLYREGTTQRKGQTLEALVIHIQGSQPTETASPISATHTKHFIGVISQKLHPYVHYSTLETFIIIIIIGFIDARTISKEAVWMY